MIRSFTFLVGLSLAAFFKFRVLPDIRAHRGTKKMDTDIQGNYDLDGVSYDPASYNVIVTGDGQAPDPCADIIVVKHVVTLHAPQEEKSRGVGA